MVNKLEAIDIDKISYPDFVGLTKQENTPPGAISTIEYWCDKANITNESFILDLACSTGFSLRMCSLKTGQQFLMNII